MSEMFLHPGESHYIHLRKIKDGEITKTKTVMDDNKGMVNIDYVGTELVGIEVITWGVHEDEN